ncbi:Hypothetical_protein [Hexamita inflata]|uniref:Hypothetical_protein n=1 Tax=Hexamita inflata TaxID=28002 RepID=A0AA86QPU6_9EUKA|nr:Hypothetical protein HINF_LOCUS48387 [Hexamita inflata]
MQQILIQKQSIDLGKSYEARITQLDLKLSLVLNFLNKVEQQVANMWTSYSLVKITSTKLWQRILWLQHLTKLLEKLESSKLSNASQGVTQLLMIKDISWFQYISSSTN